MNFLESLGILKNALEFFGISRNSLNIFWNFQKMFGIFRNFLRAKRAGRHLLDETSGPRKAAAERLCFGKKSLPSEDQGVKTGTYLRSKKSNIDGKLPPPHLLDLQKK